MNVLEMKCLRSSVGVSRMRVSYEEVRGRAGIERELVSRRNTRVPRWLEHMARMEEYRMVRVLMAEVSGYQSILAKWCMLDDCVCIL